MNDVAHHIDHICQIAGNAKHAGIGSDLDGGFGTEQSPADLETIADLQKLESILGQHGYSAIDIDGIFFNNWLNFFKAALPQSKTATSPSSSPPFGRAQDEGASRAKARS
jgi:membrane dipeptidase